MTLITQRGRLMATLSDRIQTFILIDCPLIGDSRNARPLRNEPS